ncbi:MAG: hypothetical protein LBT00_14860 [Spirochaetaceae bacterium]|jgi:hypothetical protein|nr:hypothetical protein [Spirochaetaceae bacterium]
MRLKRLVLFAVWALVSAAFMPFALFAEEMAFQFTPVSVAGSGGVHNAEEDGVFTLLSNPALLNSVTSSMFLALSGGVGDVYRDGMFEFGSPPVYYTVTGPLALGVISKGVGYGIFNHVSLQYGRLDTDVVGVAGIDWVLIDTTGFKLDFGLAPKVLFRFRQTNTGTVSLFAPSITPGILFSFGERFRAGIRYGDALSVALLANGAEDIRISRSLDAGIAVEIVSNGTLGLTLFADYRDLLRSSDDGSVDPLRQLGVGLRVAFWNNFWLSAGMSARAPTGGFGVNLGAVKLDTALSAYGAEVGIRIMRE